MTARARRSPALPAALAAAALALAGCGQQKANLSPPAPPPMPPGVTWAAEGGAAPSGPSAETEIPASAASGRASAASPEGAPAPHDIITSEGDRVPWSPPEGDPEPADLVADYNSMLRAGRVWQTGIASYYGPREQGRYTASGEVFDYNKMTAASRLLPLGTVVRVTDLKTGKSVQVVINDRGPFWPDRILDLSLGAARVIGVYPVGLDAVRVEIVRLPDPVPPGRYTVQVGWFNDDGALARCRERMQEQTPRGFNVNPPVIAFTSDEGHWLRYDKRIDFDLETAESIATDLRGRHFPAYVVRLN